MKKIYFLLIFIPFITFAQSPGDIVITEFLNDSKAVDDAFGEWVEIYNTTDTPIDLNNWTLKDDDTNSFTFTESVIVPAKSYFLMGRGPKDSTQNGGVNLGFSYGDDFILGNNVDEIVLLSPTSIEIDRVNYGASNGFPDGGAGISISLDGTKTMGDNNDGANWCLSTTAFGDGDLGTPGVENPACSPVCQASLGTYQTACDTKTTGTDTYSITIAYTGAATGETFVVTSSTGTIGGDNPTSVADGTITVTNINEGTNVTLTVSNKADGGLCELTETITSPVCEPTGTVELELKGIIDFTIPNSSNAGKAIHLVATENINDLSLYGIGIANNGGGTDGQEYTFPNINVNKGEHILLARDLTEIEKYFTTAGYNLFNHKIVATTAISQNGDDAVELFKNANVIETFGDINVDGTGKDWEYKDSWAYKNTPGAVWPNGWIYGTVDCTDGTTTIFETTCVYPFVKSLSIKNNNVTNIGIYPNPITKVNKYLHITSNSTKPVNVTVYTVLGRVVKKETTTNNKINLSTLKTGIYLINFSQEKGSVTKKIIVE